MLLLHDVINSEQVTLTTLTGLRERARLTQTLISLTLK